MRGQYRKGSWLLCFLLIATNEVLLTSGCGCRGGGCGCGGGGGGSSAGNGGGISDLTGILIGFLLAKTMSNNEQAIAAPVEEGPPRAAASSLFFGGNRKLAIDQPPSTSGGRIEPLQKVVLSHETVHRIEAMRKQNGFGFLWGASAAKTLKKMADEIEHNRTSGANKKAEAPKLVSAKPKETSATPRNMTLTPSGVTLTKAHDPVEAYDNSSIYSVIEKSSSWNSTALFGLDEGQLEQAKNATNN